MRLSCFPAIAALIFGNNQKLPRTSSGGIGWVGRREMPSYSSEMSFVWCSIDVLDQEVLSAAGSCGFSLMFQDFEKDLVCVALGCDSKLLGHHICSY